jgi:hypothetical protein
VNVSAPVRRGAIAEILEHLLPPLLRAAAAIESDLARMRQVYGGATSIRDDSRTTTQDDDSRTTTGE